MTLVFNALVPPFDNIGTKEGAESIKASETTQTVVAGEFKPEKGFTAYEIECAGNITITGIEAPATGERNLILVRNISTHEITLENEGASLASAKIRISTGANLVLMPKQSVLLWYGAEKEGLGLKWLDLNAAPMGGSVTNASIKSAAGIEESKLAIPEVIKKLTTQTINQLKNFEAETPAEVSTANGTNAPEIIRIKGAFGGSTSIATTGSGGTGTKIQIATQQGGTASNAVTKSLGGPGGGIEVKTGGGGEAVVNSTGKQEGGNAGALALATGTGGSASSGTEAGTATSGFGGKLEVTTGKGGTAESTGGNSTAGGGGAIAFTAGEGGSASGTGPNSAGSGGTITLKAGKAGSGGGAGVGGNVTMIAGAHTEAAKAGTIILQTGTVATTRLTITGEGAANFTKGIGVFAKAAPAAQPAEIKPEEITVKALMEKLNTLHKEYGLTA